MYASFALADTAIEVGGSGLGATGGVDGNRGGGGGLQAVTGSAADGSKAVTSLTAGIATGLLAFIFTDAGIGISFFAAAATFFSGNGTGLLVSLVEGALLDGRLRRK